MSWFDSFAASEQAPPALAEWARAQPDKKTAWLGCSNPEWQLWLAAHVPNLPPDDQRTVIRAALHLAPEESTSFFDFVRPWVTSRQALGAWSRGAAGRLDSREKLIGGNHAFMVALVGVIIIDRAYGAVFGSGAGRAIIQAAAVLISWGILTVPFVWLRRIALEHAAAGRSFAAAVAEVATLIRKRPRGSKEDPAIAEALRGWLRFFANTHFA